ncbi:MAG: GntR family transcriptional regulator [Chloroflexi bacterium]|nr:GntR family transcriptional regulator [Chloroflexota bacterium]
MDTFQPDRVAPIALSQLVVAALRRAIILGELPAGLHLEEPALAGKFGISRVPIREALTRLSHEGLVRMEPRRGAFVIGAGAGDIHDIYDFRLLLEIEAIQKAAPRLTGDDLTTLAATIDQMRSAVRADELLLIADPDVAFHQHLIVASGSRRLLAAWEQIVGLVSTLLSIADTTYRDMGAAVESHQAILDALAARDAATAAALTRQHLGNGANVMLSAMAAARAAASDGAIPSAAAG